VKKVLIFLVILSSILAVAWSIYQEYSKAIKPLAKEAILPIYNSLKGLNVNPKSLKLSIGKKELKALKKIRKKALKSGYLTEGKDKYLSAEIKYSGKKYKVKLRLKGDLTDHLKTDKWSFRVKAPDGKQVNDMATFSLQHPNTRNFIYEWIFHKALQSEGLLSLDYEFVMVSINKKKKGIYAMEEHFNDYLLTKNERKSGVILKFDEKYQWELARQKEGKESSHDSLFEYTFRETNVVAFHEKDLSGSDELKLQLDRAKVLLEAFVSGTKSTSEVFDVDQLAKFYALCDMLGAQHACAWRNARYYYNARKARLEPIGYDGNSGTAIDNILGLSKYAHHENESDKFYHSMIFSDSLFTGTYRKYVQLYAVEERLSSLLNALAESMEVQLAIIESEFPGFEYDENVFRKNQQMMLEGIQQYNKVRVNQ